jgi:hypothetical protein
MDKMWRHFCPVERSLMAVGNGEECNWCGAKGDRYEPKDELNTFPSSPVNDHTNIALGTGEKAFDLVANHPAGPLFDPWAQKIAALGVVLFLLLWGVAIKAVRKRPWES